MKKQYDWREYRDGNFQIFLDNIKKMMEISSNIWKFDSAKDFEGKPDPKKVEEIAKILRSIRSFDITEIGDLYLTSGGRVVLDKGYGEYFTEGDTVIASLEDLKSGIGVERFKKLLAEAIKARNKK